MCTHIHVGTGQTPKIERPQGIFFNPTGDMHMEPSDMLQEFEKYSDRGHDRKACT